MSDEGHTQRLEAALAGRYRIERKLGEGGMASVYLAEDLKHGRRVALKILRPELAAVLGTERFLSEIQTTANLQHPHILPLFDSGTADSYLYYVMPYIDGETLREKLDREKQLGVDESVRIARDVADALDYAHRHDVIHRDIKPGNILLHDGRPVVADFGIALAVTAAGGGRMTETGLSLGTPHYMSPEQASADRDLSSRSDVYSLGCVLYEMLGGQPPHTGPSAQSILVHILTEDPKPLSALRHTIPPHVAAAVAKAIEKLPADRFQNAKEFKDALEDPTFTYEARTRSLAQASSAPTVAAPPGQPAWRRGLPWVAAALLALGWAASSLGPSPPATVQRYPLSLDDLGYGNGPSLAISPDGRTIAYMGTDQRLYWRPITSLEAQVVPGSDESRSPFFSPDGRTIGYTVGPANDDRIRTMSLDGAPPRTLSGDHFPGGAWGDDGFVYYVLLDGSLLRVSEQGGDPELLADPSSGHFFRWPQPLPGGHALLVSTAGQANIAGTVAVFDIDTRQVRPLVDGTFARYANGHVFWVDGQGTLFAAPFDLGALDLSGAGIELADGVQLSLQGSYDFAVSETGTLIYTTGTATGAGGEALAWLDRDGGASVIDPRLASDFGDMDNVALSPDGRYVAVEVQTDRTAPGERLPSQIWIYDLERGLPQRLTFRGDWNAQPRWLPDGRTVAYLSDQGDGPRAIWAQPFDRTGSDELLVQAEWPIQAFDVAPVDGFPIILSDGLDPDDGLWLARPGTSTVEPFLVTEAFREWRPRISPDGHWVAYQSNESGRDEVYVRSFPGGGRPWPISRDGGTVPIWSRSGDEIFFWVPGNGLTSANVQLDDGVRVTPSLLFLPLVLSGGLELNTALREFAPYDVTQDGAKLLVIMDRTAASVAVSSGAESVVLVLNVFEELAREGG